MYLRDINNHILISSGNKRCCLSLFQLKQYQKASQKQEGKCELFHYCDLCSVCTQNSKWKVSTKAEELLKSEWLLFKAESPAFINRFRFSSTFCLPLSLTRNRCLTTFFTLPGAHFHWLTLAQEEEVIMIIVNCKSFRGDETFWQSSRYLKTYLERDSHTFEAYNT